MLLSFDATINVPPLNEEPTMSQAELERYKQMLLQLRGRLTGEVERIIEAVQQDVQAPGTISNLPVHPADQASDGLDVEVDILKNEQDILREVDSALGRVEEGTYGACQQCSLPIDDRRLDAIPFTPYCVHCAAKLESPVPQ
jgi:RNA polymerase-binding transcription factor DksA